MLKERRRKKGKKKKKMEKFFAPEAITGEVDLNEQWRRFKREFLLFLTATDKGEASEKIKLALFLRLVGQRMNDLYETMQFVEGEDRTSWSVVEGNGPFVRP